MDTEVKNDRALGQQGARSSKRARMNFHCTPCVLYLLAEMQATYSS
jgi:hypothetical protein